jgi:hypothetical protein
MAEIWKGRKISPESFRGSAEPIFLPSFRQAGLPRHSRCGDGGSHPVAVSRSDLEKGSGKTYAF